LLDSLLQEVHNEAFATFLSGRIVFGRDN